MVISHSIAQLWHECNSVLPVKGTCCLTWPMLGPATGQVASARATGPFPRWPIGRGVYLTQYIDQEAYPCCILTCSCSTLNYRTSTCTLETMLTPCEAKNLSNVFGQVKQSITLGLCLIVVSYARMSFNATVFSENVNESWIHTLKSSNFTACEVVVTAVSKLREHMRCHSQEKLVRIFAMFWMKSPSSEMLIAEYYFE